MKYEDQLQLKHKIVEDTLREIVRRVKKHTRHPRWVQDLEYRSGTSQVSLF